MPVYELYQYMFVFELSLQNGSWEVTHHKITTRYDIIWLNILTK